MNLNDTESKTMLESDIEKELVKWCLTQGYECLKLRIDGENGFPDRTVITPKGIYFIELKRPGGKLRARQRVWLARLEKLGHKAGCFDSFEAAKESIITWDSQITK